MIHEGPYDFWRLSNSGLRWLFRGYEEIASGSIDGPGTALRWALRYFIMGITRSKFIGLLSYLCCVWLSWLDRLFPDAYGIMSSSGFFFFGKKSAYGLEIKSIISYYRGI